jgi:hypothetical protein
MARALRGCALCIALNGCGRIGFDAAGDAPALDVGTPLATMQVRVSSRSNLWGAGHAIAPADLPGGEGMLPMRIDLPAGAARVLAFTEVAGTISYGSGLPENDADGTSAQSSNRSFDGLSAPSIPRQRHVSAVALDNTEPADPAPSALVMDAASATFTVGLRQIFFVGDGLTGTGSGVPQTFAIPDAATRMFLGFMDSRGGTGPGGYQDNTGEITGTMTLYGQR